MGHGNIPGHWHFKTRRCLVVPTKSPALFLHFPQIPAGGQHEVGIGETMTR